MIAEGVVSRAEHERRLCSPNGYRPGECPRCHGTVLHVHDYRERQLRGEPGVPVTRIARHECAGCDAIWQTLPEFLARHLWRTWSVVEEALIGGSHSVDGKTSGWPRIPERTLRRWSSRWFATARFIVQILASCGQVLWAALAIDLGLDATRGAVVEGHARTFSTEPGRRVAALAAQIDRLNPGVRLM